MAPVTTWRICTPRYAETAFSGEGARIYGGRWNSKGRAVVYASESIALAVLEQLVHVEDPAVLDAFVVVSATLEEEAIEFLPPSSLPDDWRTYPAPPSTRRIGDAWLSQGRSLALRVPSVTVRGQHNYLINPSHPDFAGIEVSEPEPLDSTPGSPAASTAIAPARPAQALRGLHQRPGTGEKATPPAPGERFPTAYETNDSTSTAALLLPQA